MRPHNWDQCLPHSPVLGIDLRTLYIPGKHLTTELHLSPEIRTLIREAIINHYSCKHLGLGLP